MPSVAFVINRTLLRDPRGFLRRCRSAAADRGWEPWFAETTGAETGLALTRRAVAAGASLVFAAGGDGTVRACAEALAGTGVPLAIVPLGTANLTARALGVPARAGAAVDAGFGGRDRRIDLASIDLASADEASADEASADGTSAGGTSAGGSRFAAMAGIGLDAAVVGAARGQLKRRFGWAAYAVSGLMRLSLPPRDFTVRLDDGEPLRRRARCVVVARRPSSWSKVSPSSLSSSSGPVIPIRWCRLRAEMRLAVAVIVRSGRSTRPAISQPRPTEASAMMPSATPDSMSSWSRVLWRSPTASCWSSSWQAFICAAVGSVLADGGEQAVATPTPPVTSCPPVPAVPAVPAVAPPLVRSVTVCGSCWATRKYVMISRHAAEARNRPT